MIKHIWTSFPKCFSRFVKACTALARYESQQGNMTDGDIDHLIHSKLDASQYGTGGCEVECLFIARTAHPDPISTSRIEGTFFNSQLYSICGNIGTFHNGVLTDARTTMKGVVWALQRRTEGHGDLVIALIALLSPSLATAKRLASSSPHPST